MSRADKPEVSVVVPTFNRASMLIRALDSVAAQTWSGRMECIVVDNASSDATPEVLGAWADANPQVPLITERWPHNVGAVENWRRGLDMATGKWVKILWSDDWMEPEAVERLMSEAERGGAGTVTCGAVQHGAGGGAASLYSDRAGPYGDSDVIRSVVESSTSLPVSPSAGLILLGSARAGLHLARTLGRCAERAIGPDLMMLYHDVFDGGQAVHINEPLVHFWGGDVGAEDASITQTSRMLEIRTCYDAALFQMIRHFDVDVDPEFWLLLRQRSAESRITRQHSVGLLAPPELMWRKPGLLYRHVRTQVTKALRGRRARRR